MAQIVVGMLAARPAQRAPASAKGRVTRACVGLCTPRLTHVPSRGLVPLAPRVVRLARHRSTVVASAAKDPEKAPSESDAKLEASKEGVSDSEKSDSSDKQPETNGIKLLVNWFASVLSAGKLVRTVLQLTAMLVVSRLLGAGMTKSMAAAPQVYAVPYSEFLQLAKADSIGSVQVDGVHLLFTTRPNVLVGGAAGKDAKVDKKKTTKESARLKHLELGKPLLVDAPVVNGKPTMFSTVRPGDMQSPYELLMQHNVHFGSPDSRAGTNFKNVMMSVFYAVLLAFVFSRVQFPGMRLPTRTPGRQRNGRGGELMPPETTFADVAGVDEAKEELMEIVARRRRSVPESHLCLACGARGDILKRPERFAKLGARPPTGVLLVGAPGTGKTLLAKAVAGEAEVPFFSVAASEFVELYVGMGAARVREIFARAKAAAPSIVFIDEIDAVAKGRSDGRMRGMGNDEREQTLNQLLTELDGFDSSRLVICLAATNRADVLDQALRRPGRFDRIVEVQRPDRQGREEILRVHTRTRGLPLAPELDLGEVASATVGFTGAELANLVNEAALMAGRAKKEIVSRDDFESAILRSVAGIERKRSLLGSSEKGVVARHEVGHAVVQTAVARLLPGDQPRVEQLSIMARTGGALGFTYSPPQGEERSLLFSDELRGRLATLLGGRAAEEVCSSRVSTGAIDDIQRATDLAYRSVAEFGLNARVGPLSVATLANGRDDSLFGREGGGETAAVVEQEVKKLLDDALAVAKQVLRANGELLENLGAALERDERVAGAKLQEWLEGVVPPPALEAFLRADQQRLVLEEQAQKQLLLGEGHMR